MSFTDNVRFTWQKSFDKFFLKKIKSQKLLKFCKFVFKTQGDGFSTRVFLSICESPTKFVKCPIFESIHFHLHQLKDIAFLDINAAKPFFEFPIFF